MNITIFEDAYLQRTETLMQPKETHFMVANALRFVMQHVFCNITNAVSITTSSDEGPTQVWLDDILGKLLSTYSLMLVKLINLNKSTSSVDLRGKHYCNIIMIDSFKNLEKASVADYNRKSDSLEYYFIYLQTVEELIPSEMKKIFKYCFENFWMHCNIMIQNNKGEILTHTYFPFKDQQCFETETEMINKFNGERFENEVMFPDKLKNLHLCSLKLTTWIVPPFVMNRTQKFLPNHQVTGFEIFIMTEISRVMNFTLNIDVISIDTYPKNQTPATVPMEMLKNFETNMTVGYFRRTAGRDKVATPTYVTFYLSLAAVILRKPDKYKSLSIYTFPFDTATWILVLLFCGLIIVLSNFKKTKLGKNNFFIFEILLGISIKKSPTKTSKRIYFLTALISSFFLRSVYQSLLFFLFHTHLYKSPPSTIEGLVAEGYKAVCTEMSSHFIGIVPQVLDKTLPIVTLFTPNEMNPLYYLELNRHRNYAAISNFDFALYYDMEILPQDEVLLVLPVNVNEQQIGFYLAKHSYLVDRFNHYILLLQQAGLLNKWKEWTHFEFRISKQKFSPGAEAINVMVNLNQLIGFFVIASLSILMSLSIFLLELLSKRLNFLKFFFL